MGIKNAFRTFVGAAKSIPMIGPHFNCQKRLPWLMKEVNPNFSYEYFIGKVLALLKIMIFSDDYTNLAVYEGNPMKILSEILLTSSTEECQSLIHSMSQTDVAMLI